MSKIEIEFDSEDLKDQFVGWFLDGGGSYTFSESCEDELLCKGEFIGTTYKKGHIQIFIEQEKE